MQPSLFISHGAPDILLYEPEIVMELQDYADHQPKPRAIIVISAHWIDEPVGITAGESLSTIHDFSGFPESLYDLRYPAKGDDIISSEIGHSLNKINLDYQFKKRGLDHGAWIPLMIMFPEAQIPVVQVSLPLGPLNDLVRLGSALRFLREKNILIVGSGGSVHNLAELGHHDTDGWAIQFEEWLLDTVEGNHFGRLVTPSDFPRSFRQAHPTLEHYAPLVVAWAAGNQYRAGRRIHQSFTYGNLGMSCFEFN